MKTWLALSWVWLLSLTAFGQGTVYFSTRVSPLVDARIYDTDGTTPLSGSTYRAQLYAGPTAAALVPTGDPLPFRTDARAGYVDTSADALGGTRTLAGIQPFQTAYVQVRAWEAAKGASYEAARTAGGKHGSSGIIAVVTGGGMSVPANLIGLQSFSLRLNADPPVVTETLIHPTVPLVNQPIRLEVAVQGTTPFTYQWRRGDADIPGATLSSYEDPTADAGTYFVRITGPGGSLLHQVVTVSPQFTLSLVQHDGGTVTANPPGPNLAPGTVVTLTAVANSGYVFRTWSGSVSGTANPTTLLMNDHKSVEAIFGLFGGTVYFVNRSIGIGFDARIFDTDGVTPLSGPNFVAQLYAGSNADNLAAVGPAVPFLTGDGAGYFRGTDRAIPTVQAGQTAQVQIRAWDLTAGATYEAARLANGKHGANPPIAVVTGNNGMPPSLPTIPKDWVSFRLQVGAPPRFTELPRPQRVRVGTTARFEVQVSGSEPLAFQWLHGSKVLSNAKTRVLEIPAVTAADEGSYSVRVSNSLGNIESTPVTLTIAPPPVITRLTATPSPAYVGNPLRLEVAVQTDEPFTFQWRLDQSDLPGANAPILDLPAARAGTYSVRITGIGGTILRDAITVSPEYTLELVATRGGSLAAEPTRATYLAQSRVTLTATPEPGYAFGGWRADASGNANPLSLVMDGHRRVEALFLPTGGTIYFANRNVALGIDAPVFDLGGSARLSGPGFVAQLFAGPSPSTLAPVGRPIPFYTGENAGYFRGEERSIPSVAPGGLAHVQIRAWDLSAGDSYDQAVANRGKHGSSPTLTLQTGNGGFPPSLPAYLVGVASFQLRLGTPPRIVTNPSALTVIAGKSASFSVEATGEPAPAFQWKRDDVDLPGANLSKLLLDKVAPEHAGLYSVLVSNSLGFVLSTPVTLTVLVPPTIERLTPSAIVLAGDPVELHVAATGTDPISYQWFAGTSGNLAQPTGQSGPDFKSVPLTLSTRFWVRVSNPAGTTDSPTIPVTVQRRPQTITFVAPPSLTFGARPVTLEATASSGLPVALTLVSGPATLLGNLLTPTGAGTLVLAANQAGDTRYLPASTIEQSVVVQKAPAVVTFARLEQTFDGRPKEPDVSVTPPGLPLDVTYNGSTTAPTDVGEYDVQATVRDPNYTGSASDRFKIVADTRLAVIVYDDSNGSGTQDSGENGLAGVRLRLLSLDGSTEVQTAITDANGSHTFRLLTPDTYTVEETDPVGFTSTTPNLRVVTVTRGSSAEAQFGDQPAGTVAGVVFEDLDGDGLQDASERGLPQVTLHLAGGANPRSAITGPDGTYLFLDVLPGPYRVEETDPPGYTSSTPNVRAVNVASGGAAIARFGDQLLQSIGGVVFEDLNGNGAFDDGERGIDGVRIQLLRTSDHAKVDETSTDSRGAFLFDQVPAGAYDVLQLLPSGYTVLVRNHGSTSLALQGAQPPDTDTRNVTLAEGGAGSASFGINVVRTLSGMIFNDLDANGQPGPGEPGLAGIHLEIRNSQTDALVSSATTSQDGLFVVPDLPAGSYSVQHSPIPGFVSPLSPAVAQLTAATAAAVNFPVRATATASGHVFNDENGDGSRNPSEPGVGGARLTLIRTGATAPLQAETTADGTFLLTGLVPGEWRIEVAGLPGFLNTTPASVTANLAGDASLNASFGIQSELLRAPSLTREPADLTLAEGASGTLIAAAQGTEPLEYVWLKNGSPLQGANSPTLAFTQAKPGDDGTYQLRVHNAYGTALSRVARLTILNSPQDPYTTWATTESLPENARLPGQDADLDGVPNLVEFILGSAPMIPTPETVPVPILVSRNGADFLGYEIRTRVASLAHFVLESSTDLLHWNRAEARQESDTTQTDGELVRIFETQPVTAFPFRFIRLGVSLGTPGDSATGTGSLP